MTRRRRHQTDWDNFVRQTFADSVRLSLVLIVIQAIVTAFSKPLGIVIFFVVWIYTILAFISEGNNVWTASSGTALLKAVIILAIDFFVLWIFWGVNA